MPLVRVQVRNEYGLGQPELYREADREDPKAVLDGVAVAGLVGILRQLGDLAEFAAEVFHGLQEQVMNTSSRSHKLTVRLQRMESALPPLEKAVLAQKSHLHFAYTAGSVWHAHLQNEQNHFICGDLPQFIMDSYEECHDPPRLHLLDKFDSGGPGCCLKKYSDPTFYRRASASSGEANVERVSKVWKARRSKKNRTRKRNGVSHGASISNYSDRMQFASLKDGVQASPSKTVSAVDATLESDLGDQLNSFDSRPGSGYIECVFHPTYSVKPEEHDPKESPFSSLRMHLNDTIDSASVDEHSGVVDDNSPRSLSEEQTGPSSSCVTWDEKTEIVEVVEIVEPTGHPSDHEEITEMLPMDFDRDNQEKGTANFTSVDHTDFHFDNEDITTSVSGWNQLDDVESETDNYVDALNTIESESETDLDYQTKREIEQSSIFIDEETQDGTDGVIAHHSYLQPLNLESCSAAYSSSTILVSNDKPYSSSSECYAKEESPPLAGKSSIISNSRGMDLCGNDDTKEESPQMAGKSSVIGNSPSMDLCGNDDILDGSNVASVVSNLPYSGFVEPNPKAPMSDKITSVSRESQKSPTELSGVQSVMFWTNGSLLGLEPSKPPDFSVFNAVVQDSVSGGTDKVDNPSCQSSVLNGDGDAGKPDKSVQSSKILQQISSKSSTSCHNDQNGISDKKTSWRFLTTNVDAKHGKKGDSHSSIRLNDDAMHNSSKTSAVVPETEQAVTPDVNAISSDASQRDGENEYQMFGLSNGFLVNGFQRKLSLVHGEKSDPPSSRKPDGFEQKSRNQSVASQSFSERNFKGYFRSGSPANSPSSSPPLQHMKISFQPINGFEGSKLKLKFPDGSYSHDSGRDILPTFQLVPEPTTPRHDIRSESDDDTFCRSSPCMSDDYLSHQSDSNSEQWESDDSPPSKNNELYDVLRRISSAESVSSFVELDRTGHGSVRVDYGLKSPNVETSLEPCQSGRSLDLPSLSSLSPLFAQEMEIGSDAQDFPKSHLPKEPTPLPPPLPPIQWRGVMKSDSDLTAGKQASVSETLDHAFAMNTLGSTISPQSKQSQAKQQQNTDETISFTPKSKLPELQKLDGQKEVNQAIKGSGIDEKDDFLHQIRSKSFSLRRTVTEKSNVSSGPAANVKVTAILEKANAIRQAVGSDDGEDEDNWSDT